MTKISMKDPNPGIWFKFDEDDPQTGEICVRVVNRKKRQEIQRKCSKKRVEFKHGGRFEVVDQNEELFMEMLWDYTIADWKGLMDDDGKPIECNTENKLYLMQNHVGFATFVSECIGKVNDMHEERVTVVKQDFLKESGDSGKSLPAKFAKS